jgi:arginine-tRNA-protein transferase
MDNSALVISNIVCKGHNLDSFLASGWYRYGSKIFTQYYEKNEEDKLCELFWLRYNIKKVKLSRSSKKILQRNSRYSITIKPFELTEELEVLHAMYRKQLVFSTPETIKQLLEDINNVVYDTRLIEVRDRTKLIAAGIFDVGMNSIAGIKNFFDPAYKKDTPGKNLMLLKHDYCFKNGYSWYYPGYIAPGNPRFDYKLFLDKSATEVFDKEDAVWKNYL